MGRLSRPWDAPGSRWTSAALAANPSRGKRGEGMPGGQDRVVRLGRRIQVPLPERHHAPEPSRVQLVGEGALLQPPAPPVEAEVIAGLQVLREPRGEVFLDVVATRREVGILRFFLAASSFRVNSADRAAWPAPGQSSTGRSAGSVELAKTP